MKIKRREHYLSILSRITSLIVFIVALVYFIVKLLSYDISLSNRFLYFQVPSLIIISVLAVFYMINIVGNFFFTYVLFDDECIIVESNFLIRKSITVPYNNIHVYTTKQSFIYRYFKIKRIMVNSGSYNEKAEIDLTLSQKNIDLIEKKICESCGRKNISEEKMVITNKWLFLYSVLIPSKWLRPVGYTLSILTLVAISLSNNENLGLGLWILLYSAAIIISIGLNMLFILNKYYSFTLEKISGSLHISFGGLTKTTHFIDIDRINGILIKQDPLNRIFKTYQPFLYIAGFKNTREELSLPLFPIAHKKYLYNILSKFLPEFHNNIKGLSPPPIAKRNYFLVPIINFNLFFLPLTVFFLVSGEPIALFVYLFLFAALALDRKFAYENTSFSHSNHLLSATKGGLMTKRLLCRTNSIQSFKYSYTVFNQKKNISKLRLYIKSVKNKSFNIGYLEYKE